MQLQKQLQALQRALDRERNNRVALDNKRQSLESQIAELTRYEISSSVTTALFCLFTLH